MGTNQLTQLKELWMVEDWLKNAMIRVYGRKERIWSIQLVQHTKFVITYQVVNINYSMNPFGRLRQGSPSGSIEGVVE